MVIFAPKSLNVTMYGSTHRTNCTVMPIFELFVTMGQWVKLYDVKSWDNIPHYWILIDTTFVCHCRRRQLDADDNECVFCSLLL